MESYRFGAFVLDGADHRLLRDGVVVSLTPKTLDTLFALIRNRHRVVDKDELMDLLWPDAVVEENNLAQAISALRKALGDSPIIHRVIATVPGRGYRFVAPVREAGRENPDRANDGLPTPAVGGEAAADGLVRDNDVRGARLFAGWIRVALDGRHRHGRRVGAVALLAGIAAASYVVLARHNAAVVVDPATPAIAILPFRTLSGDADSEYLGVGLADTLITRIGSTRQVIVRPTSAVLSVPRDGASGRDPIAVGRRLGVAAVLDGSVRKSGDRVRLSVQLLSVPQGTLLWSDTFEEAFTHLFAVESGIVTKLVARLRPALGAGAATQPVDWQTANAGANEAYLRGRYFREQMTANGFEKGIHYFQQAIELAPDFAAAYAGLAGCHCLLAGQGLEIRKPHEAMPAARAAALQALALDDTLAEAHAAVGMIRLKYEWDWPGAERALQRAIDLNPSYAQAHLWYSMYFEAMGRADDAVREAEAARALDPLSLRANINVAAQYARAGRHADARQQVQRTLELDPDFWVAYWVLGDLAAAQGAYDEAVASLRKADGLSPGNPAVLSSLGSAYAAAGQTADAMQIVGALAALGEQRYVSPADTAAIYAALGQTDLAFQWLERAYEQRSRALVWLGVWPQYATLRADPRFDDLLHRMGRHP